MFEGNRNCQICKKEIDDKNRYFGVSLSGYTYVFCKKCMDGRKEAITELLHGD